MSYLLKKIFIGLLISLISIAFSLILIELSVRIFFSQELIYLRVSKIWEPDELLGWKHKSNASTLVNVGERMIHFKTDENGFRIGNKEIESPKFKILALGDSFVEGLQVEYEETVTGRLESILSKNSGFSVKVVNAGVAGWDANHYLLQAKTELDRDKYDLLLVFLYIGNDFVNNRQDRFISRQLPERHDFRLPHNLSKKELIDAFIYPINDHLETRSASFMFFKKRFKVFLMKLGLTANHFPEIFFKSEVNSPIYEVTADICSDIKKLALNRGIETIFVLIPTSLEVQEESLKEYVKGFNVDPSLIDMTQPNRLSKRRLENLGGFVVDPLSKMRKEYNKKEIRLYDIINDHFTSEGHKVLTNTLVPVLEEILESKQVTD